MVEPVTLPPELNPRGPRTPKGRDRDGTDSRWPRRWRIAAIVAAVAVVVTSGGLYGLYLHYNGNLTRVANVIKPGGAPAVAGAENVLLVGSDSRAGADQFAQAPSGQQQVIGQRSDTVILAHLAAGHQRATLVSLPRDSWITIPAYTDVNGTRHPAHHDKLNAAFSLGGPSLLVDTVQQLTGMHIDHYVEIDFAGFQHMVDALGGVQVCLTRAAHDKMTGIDLSAGTHELNGQQALAFVRQRYGLPLGDIDRIKRQQQFMASMMRKVESAGTLANPLKLNAFLNALTKSVSVDSGMNVGDMTKLALKLKGLSTGNVVLTTMPLKGFATESGQDVDVVDTAKAQALFQSLTNDAAPSASAGAPTAGTGSAAPTVPRSAVHVRVYNGAGVQGLAAKASADLTKAGFDVVGAPANRGTGATTTLIEYGPTQRAAATTLATAIPGATLQENDQLGTDLDLVLGSSYSGLAGTGAAGTGAAGTPSTTGNGGELPAGATTAADAGCTA